MTASGERPIAVGWATVELDRAAGELASLLVPGSAFEPVGPSVVLGARCRLGRAGAAAPAPFVILMEPSTEGPLASALARHGEGWCATWTSGADEGTTIAGPEPRELLAPTTSGPFGAERLVRDGPRSGPFRLVVDAATIAP